MRETAYAKLNLALHVRGREPDGYHRIETAFAFAEDGDLLSVAEGDEFSLSVVGPFADQLSEGEDNIVLTAASALRDHLGIAGGASLTLDKRLPVAAGIGGGSADAAAALRLLPSWWRCPVPEEELARLARRLGADVPACLYSRTAFGRGRGDALEPADFGFEGAPALLVNPGVKLSTRLVFERWNGSDGGPLHDPRLGRNDLEAPAAQLISEIRDVLGELESLGTAALTRMSGSGATCFALFSKEADRDEASRHFAERHPGWWQLATRLR
ncbi:MAG: 4-diphosphocytidyl-2-C-methyl-D-erythritol kinase [Sphingomonadales bacterium]|jgi:4-diphosphocytidyl-2-C-methyl-D-erythritol kinase|nr:4-diphosphocytidyl-2-C-methyl-D-erythritol kinase [Sphingomonadales bacterium]